MISPEAELRRTYEFLDLDREFVPPNLRQPVLETTVAKVAVSDVVREGLLLTYHDDLRLLSEVAGPSLDFTLWRTAGAVGL